MFLSLNNTQIEELRTLCADAEAAGALTPDILKIIYKEKWFKLFIPKDWRGLQLSLPEALQYEEQLAYIDGSLGWAVTLCAGANLFAGYIDDPNAQKIFSHSKVCFGGSGAATGVASITKDGYIVNGYWKYATGTPHLTHFTANCILEKNGKPVFNNDGSQAIRSFFFRRNNVTIHEEWNTMGLKATAGHSFSVKNLKVKNEQSFIINEQQAVLNDPIYHYPFMPFAETTIAVNTLGMTRHFLELVLDTLENRQNKIGRNNYDAAVVQVVAGQRQITSIAKQFYKQVELSWAELLNGGQLSEKVRQKIETLSRHLVKSCRSLVADSYPYCGLAATGINGELNRVFRDIFTASQHSLLTFKH